MNDCNGSGDCFNCGCEGCPHNQTADWQVATRPVATREEDEEGED